MDCFQHAGTAAIGLCKHCAKGLCPACAADLGFGLACRGSHEAEVSDAHALWLHCQRMQGTQRSLRSLTPMYFLVIGAIMIGYDLHAGARTVTSSIALGLVFAFVGVVVALKMWRAPQIPATRH